MRKQVKKLIRGLIGAPFVPDWAQAPSLDLYYTTTTVVPNAGTVSPEVDLRGYTLVGIFFPAALAGTTVAFQTAPVSGGTFVGIVDGAGADVSKTVAASKFLPTDPTTFSGIRFLKLVLGAAQTADRTLTLVLRPIL